MKFDTSSIEEAFKPKIYGNAVKTFKKLAINKQAIAYTYNVSSAKRLATAFNKAGITAKSVYGKTPTNVYYDIIQQFKTENFKF